MRREVHRNVLIEELAHLDAEQQTVEAVEDFVEEAPSLAADVAARVAVGNVGAAKAALRRLISTATVNTENTISLSLMVV